MVFERDERIVYQRTYRATTTGQIDDDCNNFRMDNQKVFDFVATTMFATDEWVMATIFYKIKAEK